ncbi:acyl-CoA N-acyltransferase [Pseudomassariella vexata]|uniref:Glucosamine 6-phosphate N-acetyltransferase n=1 Tax=Pseudomassariella vexata TaxID=1141098 RepID=A0A1Y2E4Y3_9PEZI|nr:acyl-CoA N-acyltransferase [Pseudomassariella vexata]ORY66589.1 acyl-CoA N-acyltransferase [Pseudomassariella vexata]
MASEALFSASLISPETVSAFPDSYNIRPLQRDDYNKGFLDCLRVLTHVGDVTEAQFQERFDWMVTQGKGVHYILVIEHESRIVGTGALVVERKFIHDLGSVAHVEEVSILEVFQSKGLGLRLLNALSSVAKNVGCYKSTLGCSEKNEPFYVKCGYDGSGRIMSEYYEEAKSGYERG